MNQQSHQNPDMNQLFSHSITTKAESSFPKYTPTKPNCETNTTGLQKSDWRREKTKARRGSEEKRPKPRKKMEIERTQMMITKRPVPRKFKKIKWVLWKGTGITMAKRGIWALLSLCRLSLSSSLSTFSLRFSSFSRLVWLQCTRVERGGDGWEEREKNQYLYI